MVNCPHDRRLGSVCPSPSLVPHSPLVCSVSIKRERELQRICETSEELKDLERQLKIAYINKERAAQHQEALLLRKLENDREQAIEEKMEYDRQEGIQRQVERENVRRQSLIAQKKVLQK